MLRTEVEARQCWCPFARTLFVESNHDGGIQAPKTVTAINRNGGSTSITKCIASECMAWRQGPDRWVPTEETVLLADQGSCPGKHWIYDQISPDMPGGPKRAVWRKNNVETVGFCGLAGGDAGQFYHGG